MQTSNSVRLLVAAFLFAGAWVIVYANLRILALWVIKRRASRIGTIVWLFLLAVLIFCVIDATKIEPNWCQVTYHNIKTERLCSRTRIRIVHLTDIHLDRLGVREIKMINLTADQHPDIIVLTGDYTNDKSPRTMRQLTLIARRLSSLAPVYAVDGNWDCEDDMKALAIGGVKILSGWTTIEGPNGARVALGEIPWYKPSALCVPDNIRDMFKIVLCHKPEPFSIAAKSGVDLMLAGHTHGGQVRIPIFGALLPDQRLVGKYQAGMYVMGGARLYVNRGIGMEGGAAPRVRFCCRPEIAVFDIVGRK